MRSPEELDRLRARATALRREGKSRREIQAILGPINNSTLNDLLLGTPPPDWTRRPNAKDELRAQARQLRADGQKYNDIAARLGVSKSSVSLWVRDLPTPPRLSHEENRKRSAAGVRRYWETEGKVHEARHAKSAPLPPPKSVNSPTGKSSSQAPSPTGARGRRPSLIDRTTA
jgi:transposase